MIRLENLVKHFEAPGSPPIVAVNNVSLEVDAGDICVFLGPSGCGKTTTLKMINKLISKTSGKIFINGDDIDNVDVIKLRHKIGYVIQQIGLFPNLTIEDNICVVPDLLRMDKRKSRIRAAELLELVNLDPNIFLRRFPKQLSGGQQQRVGVIRALAADPPVMLMDEPFGAIDPVNRATIQDEFLKMNKKMGKTVLFVSHDIDEAVKMGDKIALFKEGFLEQFDTPDEILANPKSDFVKDFVGADRTLKRLKLLNIQHAMLPFTGSVQTHDLIEVAQKKMLQNETNIMVVTGTKGRIRGYVSNDEVRVADSVTGSVGEYMVGMPAIANISEDLHTAISLMYTKGMDWLAVVDDDGVYQGYITQFSVSTLLGEENRKTGGRIN